MVARIVFCEDEERIRKLIEVAMRSTAHSIEVTVDGREGLAVIERLPPDLIVTDVAMPEMNGFALADAVHGQVGLRHIPIVFVTASVQRGDIAQFAAHGSAGHLAKPFSPRALRETIDAVLGAAPRAPLAALGP